MPNSRKENLLHYSEQTPRHDIVFLTCYSAIGDNHLLCREPFAAAENYDLNSCFYFWDPPTLFWLLRGLLWYLHWLLFQILLPALSCRSHLSGKVVSDHPTQNKEEFSLIANQIRVTPMTVFQGGLSEPMTVSLERTIRIRLIDKQF